MSFLAPLFLLGAAAVALPIAFHLIRRNSRDRIPFSSLMFLVPTPPRVTRRSKLEDLLLLLLRCSVIFLLAFAFARPFFSQPVAPESGGQTGQKIIVLLDASASMQRAGLLDDAKARAQAVFTSASAADQVACFTFDQELRSVMSFDDWLALPASERSGIAASRLQSIKPGWGATRLGNALLAASELFESKGHDEQMQQRIVLITDLQEGSRLDGLQGFEWSRQLRVQIEAVKPRLTSNAGLQLAPERDISAATPNGGPRVRISNSADSKREQFQIGWQQKGRAGPIGPTLDVYIPPGQSRIISVPAAPTNAAPDSLVLTGDDDGFDNTVFVIPPAVRRATLLYLGEDRATDPAQSLFYLRRAFQETRTFTVDVQGRAPGALVSEQDLAAASLIVISASIPDAQASAIRASVEQGKSALVVLHSEIMARSVAKLLGRDELPVVEAAAANYAMLGQLDFGHPLLAPFADPRYSDFTKIHFWKHRSVRVDGVPEVRMIARFDNGDPALAEVPAGKGRLWLLTSSWRSEDSQLALSSKFVPLLYAMLEQSGAGREDRGQYAIGDPVELQPGTDSVTVRKPDASEVRVPAGERFRGTDQPGVYSIGAGGATARFAVNLAPEESRTAPLPVEDLERLGLPLGQGPKLAPREAQHRKEHLQAAQLESRQKLWRWLIVTALVILMLETWLAGRVTRRPFTAVAETTS
jgi:hypothetical protein